MKSIGEFFDRIRGRYAGEIYLRTTVQEVIKKTTNIDIPLEAVSFKPRALILKGLSQTAKSTVFVKKLAILKELEARSPGRATSDIRFES